VRWNSCVWISKHNDLEGQITAKNQEIDRLGNIIEGHVDLQGQIASKNAEIVRQAEVISKYNNQDGQLQAKQNEILRLNTRVGGWKAQSRNADTNSVRSLLRIPYKDFEV
jgi:hypothetical protein